MAFKGSYEIKRVGGVDKKFLIRDFCTSPFNMNESRWPKPDLEKTDNMKLLQRLSRDYNLETKGINVYLEWETGSDLDINVMCGCGKWHGYGTSGGSAGSCKCDACGMYRDHDIMTGQDGRRNVFEHAYFTNLSNLYDKEIGMGVHNYSNSTNRPRNNFKMALLNENGYQLFPVKGGDVTHEASWMYTTTASKNNSTKKTYRFNRGDEHLGREVNSNNFITHASIVVREG